MKAIQLTAYGNPAQNLKLVEPNNSFDHLRKENGRPTL